MTTIYLIRHAEADGNLYRRAHGWYDSVITDRGYRQIAALAKRFTSTHFDAVYSSDRRRTMTTALSVYKTHGLPLVTTPRVREIGIGVWEDHPWAELERTDGEQLERFNTDAAHWHVAGGEHLPDVRERMIGALREIAEAHPNGTAAVFSHGMAIRLTVGTLQGLSLHEIDGTGHAENTAVSRRVPRGVPRRREPSGERAADAQAAGVAEERARLRGRYLLCALRRRGAF